MLSIAISDVIGLNLKEKAFSGRELFSSFKKQISVFMAKSINDDFDFVKT